MRKEIMLIMFLTFTFFSMPLKAEDFLDKAIRGTGGSVIERGERIEISNVYDFRKGSIEKAIYRYKSSADISVDDSALIEGRVIFNIVSKDSNFQFDDATKEILKIMKYDDNSNEVNISRYIKAELPNDDMYKYKERIENTMERLKCSNIKCVYIDSGIAGEALSPIKTDSLWDNKGFNTNFALVKYTSGTYIIIGTPIITCVY